MLPPLGPSTDDIALGADGVVGGKVLGPSGIRFSLGCCVTLGMYVVMSVTESTYLIDRWAGVTFRSLRFRSMPVGIPRSIVAFLVRAAAAVLSMAVLARATLRGAVQLSTGQHVTLVKVEY